MIYFILSFLLNMQLLTCMYKHDWSSLSFFFLYFSPVVQLQLSHLFLHCSPLSHPHHSHSHSPDIVHAYESSICVPLLATSPFPPVIPLPLSLWLVSVCSLFPSLWFYFAHLFVLLISFYLQGRSYDICLLLPGLFHLA